MKTKKRTLLEPEKGLLYGYFAPLLTIVLFIILIAISIFGFYYGTRSETAQDIAAEVTVLTQIFTRIDATCSITGFQNQKNPIDFLTVKKDGFVGSQVGSMSLAHPEKWDGPYVERNFEVQGKEYQIIRTKQGYYITPGHGVTLPNGAIIGKDIILDEHADVDSMILNTKKLRYNNQPLAARIPVNEIEELSSILPEDLAQAQQDWVTQHKGSGVRCAMALRSS